MNQNLEKNDGKQNRPLKLKLQLLYPSKNVLNHFKPSYKLLKNGTKNRCKNYNFERSLFVIIKG